MTPPSKSYLSITDRRRLEENLKSLNVRSTPSTAQKPAAPANKSQQLSRLASQNVSPKDADKTKRATPPSQASLIPVPTVSSFRIPKHVSAALPQMKLSKNLLNAMPNKAKTSSTDAVNGALRRAEPAVPVPVRSLSIAEALKAGQQQRLLPKPVAVKNAVPSRSDAAARVAENISRPGLGIAKTSASVVKVAPLALSSAKIIPKSFDDILKLQRAIGKPIIKQTSRSRKAPVLAAKTSAAPAQLSGFTKWSPTSVKPKQAGDISSINKPSLGTKSSAIPKISAAYAGKVSALNNKSVSNPNMPHAKKSSASAEKTAEEKLAALKAEMDSLRKELAKKNEQQQKSTGPIKSTPKSADIKNNVSRAVNGTHRPSQQMSAKQSTIRSVAAPATSSTPTGFIMPNVKRKPVAPAGAASLLNDNIISPSALKRRVHEMARAGYLRDHEDDEYDDDLADFVVDDDEVEPTEADDAQAELDKMFSGYRKRVRVREQAAPAFDDRQMESSWTQQQAEEMHSKRVGAIEDYNEFRLEKAQEKAKKLEKDHKELKEKLKKLEKKNKKNKKKKKNQVDDSDS